MIQPGNIPCGSTTNGASASFGQIGTGALRSTLHGPPFLHAAKPSPLASHRTRIHAGFMTLPRSHLIEPGPPGHCHVAVWHGRGCGLFCVASMGRRKPFGPAVVPGRYGCRAQLAVWRTAARRPVTRPWKTLISCGVGIHRARFHGILASICLL